jgi:addiction module HigA family antidote
MSRKKTDRIQFPHPGETLREDFLKPLRMSVNRLALELRVPATRMTEIVHGRRGVTRRVEAAIFQIGTFWGWITTEKKNAKLKGCRVDESRQGTDKTGPSRTHAMRQRRSRVDI